MTLPAGPPVESAAQVSLVPDRHSTERSVHEPYLTTGISYYSSERRVLAGVGGGVGYRLHLTREVSLYAEGRWLVYLGNSFVAASGGSYEFSLGPFDSLVGLQGALFGGDHVDVISSTHPAAPSPVAWAAQVRLAPLRLVREPFAVSLLSVDIGFGIDDGSRGFALTVTIMDIGIR